MSIPRTHSRKTPPPPDRAPRRAGLWVGFAFALLGAAGALAYAGPAYPFVVYRLLTDGTIALAWVASGAGLGAFALGMLFPNRSPAGRRADPPHAAPGGLGVNALLRFTSAAALGLGLLGLAVLGLGLAGWLNRATAVFLLAPGFSLGLLSVRLARREREALRQSNPDPAPAFSRWNWLWLLAAPFLSVALIGAMVPPGVLWSPEEPHGYDVAEYHLQVPREWYEAGRIAPLRHNVFSYFPMGVEAHYLLAMHLRGGPWEGMFLAQLMHLSLMVLAVLAACGFAQTLAPRRAAATVASVALATLPWLAQLGAVAYNEGGFLLYGTLAAGWALLGVMHPPIAVRRFVLGGAMAGLACGTKLTAVPEVLLGVPLVCAAVTLAASRGRPRDFTRRVLRGCLAFVGVGLLLFSPWLVRNVAWTGNPVFPEAAGVLGKAHLTDAQVSRWHDANHLPGRDRRGAGGRLRAAWEQILGNWQFGYVLFPLSAVSVFAAAGSAIRRKPARDQAGAPAWRGIFGGRIFRRRREGAGGGAMLRRAAELYDSVGAGGTRVDGVERDAKGVAARVAVLFPAGMLLLLSVFWVGFTHLQGRFFLMAAPLGVMLVAWLDWGRGLPFVASLVFLSAAVGWWGLHRRIVYTFREQQVGASRVSIRASLGMTPADLPLDWLTPLDLAPFRGDAPGGNSRPADRLTLVGESRAFWYQVPMSRLRYRTIFDASFPAGPADEASVVSAWAGRASGEKRPPGEWLVIDPSELRRFADTYGGVPRPPGAWAERQEPLVVPPGEAVPR